MFYKVTGLTATVLCVFGVLSLDSDGAFPIILCLICLFYIFMVIINKWDEIVRKYELDDVEELIRRERKHGRR